MVSTQSFERRREMGLWVFDLDGTLVTSNIDYGYAVLDFTRLMLRTFEHRAPYYQDIINLEQEIDRERFKTMRADRNRFPGSLIETYREICRRTKNRPDSEVEGQVWEIGYSALSEDTYQNRSMIPGAEQVLEFLLAREGRIFCVTAGDAEVQWMKWRGYNLRRFFPTPNEFRVVKWGKEETLARLRDQYPDSYAVMVGDSVGSDLWAAHKAGMTPVHVPAPAVWDHGELEEELPPGTRKVPSIRRLLGVWEELNG